MLKHSVGLDISKEDFHACFSLLDDKHEVKQKRSGTFPNNLSGFKKLMAWITKERQSPGTNLVVVMEATGVYHEQCALFLENNTKGTRCCHQGQRKSYRSPHQIKSGGRSKSREHNRYQRGWYFNRGCDTGETNGFLLFKNHGQLVSYAGYDVVENQSGKHTGRTKISKKGNSNIRRILHMPALSAVRHQEPPFINLFLRTYERHKIKMKSYVAVQKKLLCMIYTLWKNNARYDPAYLIKNTTREGEMEHSSRHGFAEAK